MGSWGYIFLEESGLRRVKGWRGEDMPKYGWHHIINQEPSENKKRGGGQREWHLTFSLSTSFLPGSGAASSLALDHETYRFSRSFLGSYTCASYGRPQCPCHVKKTLNKSPHRHITTLENSIVLTHPILQTGEAKLKDLVKAMYQGSSKALPWTSPKVKTWREAS